MLRILAAFIFFTRLPFWKLAEVPAEYFKNIVSRWALVGWVTAGLMVIVLYAGSLVLPSGVALALAMITRLLITGCLHEDGLADFFDGFGGGTKPGTDIGYYERLAYRKLWSHWFDLLFWPVLFVAQQSPGRTGRLCHPCR